MLKLRPIVMNKIWGREYWLASTHPCGRQEDFFRAAGGEYPLLVKIIQADDRLSVQVHPDDRTAADLEGAGFCGKTECWYALDAADGARIVYGLKEDFPRARLEAAVRDGTLEHLLNVVPVRRGDFIFIPSGTVHAIGAGLRLLEVQQSCDLTYRLYDWGRGRELHVEKGLLSVRHGGGGEVRPFSGEFRCDYFSLEKTDVRGRREFLVSGGGDPASWQLLFVIEGGGTIRSGGGESFRLEPDGLYALAPGESVVAEGGASLMRIRVGAARGG